jgi:ATP synthase protein I
MMARVVFVQFIAVAVLSVGGGLLGGAGAARSALLGGLACAVPNALFALNLAVLGQVRRGAKRTSGNAATSVLPILLGEFCKVLLTAALLALVVGFYKEVVWLALIVSVGAVLLVQPFALAGRRS